MGFTSELKKTSKGAEILKDARRGRPMGRNTVVKAIIDACFAEDTVANRAELLKEYLPLIERWDTKPYRKISSINNYLEGVASGFYKDKVPVVKIGETDFAF